MNLDEIGVIKSKEKQFNKKGIYTTEDLLRFLPRKYYDFSNPSSLNEWVNNTQVMCLLAYLTEVAVYEKCMQAVMLDKHSGRKFRITWFTKAKYMEQRLKKLTGEVILCCGKVSYDDQYHSYSMNEPMVFSEELEKYKRIYPVYPAIQGMSADYLITKLEAALSLDVTTDSMDADARKRFKVVSEKNLYQMIHRPKSVEDVKMAQRRLIIESLYHFAKELHKESVDFESHSQYIVKTLAKTNQFIKSLPYILTPDQQNTLNKIIEQAKAGEHINALIQGDVGCGKTIVAFICMFAMADNGYQSALIAPTGVLAKQHYEELKKYADELGFKTAFLGNQKVSEKKKIIKALKEGECDFVVGTHALFSESVEFKNLGLSVCDEEHRFGVLQREHLQKNNKGMHHIIMSATPIPRTLAKATMGTQTEVYTIKSMPNGRKPVKTCVSNNEKPIYKFMNDQIKEGHQCYIICPLKEENENIEIESVEEVYEKTAAIFNNTGVKVEMLTGGMTQEQTDEILGRFSKNETQILIATTIVEVGVNVPNSTVIAIWNAERFGLATLHQLRGRVGRGSFQSYCILKSSDSNNPRLDAMVETTDGFEIAKKDLAIRGAGDFIGTKQSGETKEVMLMLKYPKLFDSIQAYIVEKEKEENKLVFE